MKRVLIISHLRSLLEREQTILSRSEFSVDAAPTNDELLALHKAEKAAMIITELDPAGMRGDQLCSEVRAGDGKQNTAIILVCNNRPADIERVSRCGASAYLTRPVWPHHLTGKVSQLLSASERKSYRVLLQVTVEGNARDRYFMCTSRNISASGILIETDKALQTGDRIACSFFLPHSQRIVAHGEVARVVPKPDGNFQYGIRFTDLDQELCRAIEEFVSRHR